MREKHVFQRLTSVFVVSVVACNPGQESNLNYHLFVFVFTFMQEDWLRIAQTPRETPLPRYYDIVRREYWEAIDAGANKIEIRALRTIVIITASFDNDVQEISKIKIVPLVAREQWPWNLPPWTN